MNTDYLKIRSRSINRAERRAMHKTFSSPGSDEDTIYDLATRCAEEEDLSDEHHRKLAADISHRLETLYPSKAVPIFTQ